MSYVYINEAGANVNVDGGHCVIKSKNGMLTRIPIETIEYVSVFGNVNITTPAMQMFMKNKIPVTLYSGKGAYFGRILSNERVNISRQRKQFELSGKTEFSLNIAKRIVAAKIHNQSVILSRYSASGVDLTKEYIKQMRLLMKDIAHCTSIEQLMGYEGIAARHYFKGLSLCIEPEFRFNGRSRRPPRDEFNSLISLGYAMLMNEIYGAAEGKGLNVYAGFLHQDRENHPTLASDLMEEWRSVIIDSLAMSLINGHEIKKDEFTVTDDGAILSGDAMHTFFKKYENKMKTLNSYITGDESRTSFRKSLWLQTSALAKAIDEKDYTLYNPIWIR